MANADKTAVAEKGSPRVIGGKAGLPAARVVARRRLATERPDGMTRRGRGEGHASQSFAIARADDIRRTDDATDVDRNATRPQRFGLPRGGRCARRGGSRRR